MRARSANEATAAERCVWQCGDERLYVRAVTATSGDAGERRDRPGDDSTANTADAVEQKRGSGRPDQSQ